MQDLLLVPVVGALVCLARIVTKALSVAAVLQLLPIGKPQRAGSKQLLSTPLAQAGMGKALAACTSGYSLCFGPHDASQPEPQVPSLPNGADSPEI